MFRLSSGRKSCGEGVVRWFILANRSSQYVFCVGGAGGAARSTEGLRCGPKEPANGQVRPHAADQNLINFIRPGISVKVVSAAIANDGTITARVNISDPKGLPLDMTGVTTPGAVTLRLIAAYIPAGQKQFVAYTTTLAKATLNSNPSQTQAATDSGGTWKTNADRRLHLHVRDQGAGQFRCHRHARDRRYRAARSERVHDLCRVCRDRQRCL